MDYNNPTRGQHKSSPYAASQQEPGNTPRPETQNALAAGKSFQRVSHSQHLPSATIPTGGLGGHNIYGFNPSSQYGMGAPTSVQALHYTAHLHMPDLSRQQEPQQYGHYEPNVMYGLAPRPPLVLQTTHDPGSRFTQPVTVSATAASRFDELSTVPHHLTGQSVPPGVTLPDLAPSPLHPQYQTPYEQAGSSTQTYPSVIMGPPPPKTHSIHAAQHAQHAQHGGHPGDRHLSHFRAQLRTIFSHVREGSLREVGNMLIEASHHLLDNVEALGLTTDNDSLHDERLRIWEGLNRAWLTALQAQLDLMQESVRARTSLGPASLMSPEMLELLARMLIHMCDDVERHGLVDYEMGIAEEEIMDLILRCLDQSDPEGASETRDTAG